MNARSMRLLRSVAAGLLAGLWICWTVSHAHGQTVLGGIGLGENTGSSGTTAVGMASYRGQAAVVAGTALGIPTSVSDTGPLPCSGGAREASLLEQDLPPSTMKEVRSPSVSLVTALVIRVLSMKGSISLASGNYQLYSLLRTTAMPSPPPSPII